jgi:hypothetical protein
VARYSGAAMAAYAEFLVAERKGLRSRARKLVRRFEEKVAFKDMKPEVWQIASNLGVLYAGARLASEAGLLRCTNHEIGSALRQCFQRAVAALVDDRKVLRSALMKLQRKLAGDTVLRVQEVRAARSGSSCDGWREKEPDGIVYTVRAQAILRWLADPLARRLALEWLNERGFIIHAKRVARSSSAGLEWVERQTSWPDGSRPRSVVLKLPNGLDDLTHL